MPPPKTCFCLMSWNIRVHFCTGSSFLLAAFENGVDAAALPLKRCERMTVIILKCRWCLVDALCRRMLIADVLELVFWKLRPCFLLSEFFWFHSHVDLKWVAVPEHKVALSNWCPEPSPARARERRPQSARRRETARGRLECLDKGSLSSLQVWSANDMQMTANECTPTLRKSQQNSGLGCL